MGVEKHPAHLNLGCLLHLDPHNSSNESRRHIVYTEPHGRWAWLNLTFDLGFSGQDSCCGAMATPYPPGPSSAASAEPCSKVELSISCADLLDKDLFSKSDPIVAVYTRPNVRGQPFTEVCLDRTGSSVVWGGYNGALGTGVGEYIDIRGLYVA